MSTHTRLAVRTGWRSAVAAGTLALAAGTAAAEIIAPDFVYDTTSGLTGVYSGDLDAGVWQVEDIDGRSFRAQRWLGGIWGPQPGWFGYGPGPASFTATMHLVEFIDNTPNGSGDSDVAIFIGEGDGVDLVAVDEQGNTLEANVDYFEIIDATTTGVRPGYQGQGLLTDVIFSGPKFHSTCTHTLEDVATTFTFTFTMEDGPNQPITLEDYLASDGLGGLAVEIETWELRIQSSGCYGDLDGDADVDQEDLAILLNSYRVDDGGDLDCTGFTDQGDLGILLANYGVTCP